MELVRKVNRMRSLARQARRQGRIIGFVPTMGALHEGHLSLLRRARRMADVVVMSVFVNPAQFAPGEDFEQYPRDLVRDAELARKEDVHYLFAPEAGDMYPGGMRTYVNVSGLSKVLCGASRQGHFRGVATVVAQLFHIVAPHFAFFGFKDAQQSVIVRAMAEDLHMDVEIVVCPTVREADGLAMSSRNLRLSHEERRSAASLFRALTAVQEAFSRGETSAAALRNLMRETVEAQPQTRVDYAEISDPRTLQPLTRVEGEALASLAVFVGATRLIDNLMLTAPAPNHS
jgi:pantoate--beta-alanine ligase